jgi:SAM-dependent methyltransferase
MDDQIGTTIRWLLVVFLAAIAPGARDAGAQVVVGQDGKDVVYLPTPPELVNKMLDMAGVTPQDYVIDLGSGDGRIVIAAAKRGARALGIEYDGPLVELSRRTAESEHVSDKARFVQADLFESEFSEATVLTMFLLSDIMLKLQPKIFDLRPGTRVVSNSFEMDDWAPDDSARIPNCKTWCTAHLWIVPARVQGTWRLPQGDLTLKQNFQDLSGTLTAAGKSVPISFGHMRGAEIAFTAGGARYSGRIAGATMQGTVSGTGGEANWTATRTQ